MMDAPTNINVARAPQELTEGSVPPPPGYVEEQPAVKEVVTQLTPTPEDTAPADAVQTEPITTNGEEPTPASSPFVEDSIPSMETPIDTGMPTVTPTVQITQEPEPAPVAAAPVQPSVTATEPVVEEDIDQAPEYDEQPVHGTAQTFTLDISKVSLRNINDHHVTIKGKTYIVRDITNRTLKFFVNDYARSGAIDEELKIQGTHCRFSGNDGLWEEGGATPTNGSVMFPTAPDGKPLCPVTVNMPQSDVNGSHALFQVWPGCYIVLGGHSTGKMILGVYRIDEIEEMKGASEKIFPRLICHLVGSISQRTWTKIDTNDQIWYADHPALKAAKHRIYELYATTPCYKLDYKKYPYQPADIQSLVSDSALLQKLETCSSLSEAYSKVGALLTSAMTTNTNKDVHAVSAIILNYKADKEEIHCFITAQLFNNKEKSSAGNRLGIFKVILKMNDKFWYINSIEPNLTGSAVRESIVNSGLSSSAAIYRRITPA